MTNEYETDQLGVLAKIVDQVERLVVPGLYGLRGLFLERQAAVREQDNALAREQDEVACEGMAAGFRLMMIAHDPAALPSVAETTPYIRALPESDNGRRKR